MKQIKVVILILTIIMLAGATSLISQGRGAGSGRGTARQKGIVMDPDGKPMAGVKVTFEYLGSKTKLIKHETTTNAKGEWIFFKLGFGRWKVEINVKDMVPYADAMTVSQVNVNPVHKIKLQRSGKVIAQEKLSKEAGLVGQGNQLYKDRKYDEALSSYQQFLSKNPEFFQLHFNIANCYKEKREYDTAIAEYKKVLEKTKDETKGKELKAKSLAAIGEVYLLKDDRKTASDYFKQSIEMNPADEILAYNVAEIYFAGNKVKEAITYYQMAAKIKPKWSEPYLKIGYAYMNQGDFKKAIESLNTFLKIDPDSPQAPVVKDIIKSLKQD